MEKEFEDFYKKYYRYVFKVIASAIANRNDAEDLISQVFMNIWDMRSSLDFDDNLKALVILISKRRVNDFLRKKYKIKEFFTEFEDEEDFTDETINNYKDVNSTDINLIRKIVNNLDQKYLDLYNLKYLRRLSSSEIAIEMGISKNYVKVLNNRLISKIKKEWEIKKETLKN